MNHNCKCGGVLRPSSRKECCVTKKQWMVFNCDSCGKKYEQGLRMAKGVVQPGEIGSEGFWHYAPYITVEAAK